MKMKQFLCKSLWLNDNLGIYTYMRIFLGQNDSKYVLFFSANQTREDWYWLPSCEIEKLNVKFDRDLFVTYVTKNIEDLYPEKPEHYWTLLLFSQMVFIKEFTPSIGQL